MPERYARIFLLSHMRACTSLAGHVLGSHPRISGYFEMHISYDDATALDRQLERLRQHEALKANGHYLFDKLLHNDYLLDSRFLNPAHTRVLVCLAEPEHTIKSIIDLFAKKETPQPYAMPQEATNYYIKRLRTLADFCQSADQPYYYYDAELFRLAPEKLLPGLAGWLELDSPLGERYQLFSQTGRPRQGDSSERIRSGKIDRRRVDYSHITLPEEMLDAALEVYRDCRSRIIDKAADSLLVPDDVGLRQNRRSQASRSVR